jgi:general secretion pathway protein C
VAILLADKFRLQSFRLAPIPFAKLVLAILSILVALQIVRLVFLFVADVGPLGNWRAVPVNIVSSSARGALFTGFDPFFRSEAVAGGTQNVTSLNLTLYGIRSNENSGGGSAIIAGEDGIQNSFAVGEEVTAGVVLDAVAFDHVILSRGGVKESLYLDQSVPAETVGTGTAAATGVMPPLPASTGAQLNAESLQKSIGLAPRNEGGRVTGLVLQPRDDGTMMRLAGFQDGDVVVAVNGRPVSTAADVASQFRPGTRLSIEVERAGSKIPIALNLEKP